MPVARSGPSTACAMLSLIAAGWPANAPAEQTGAQRHVATAARLYEDLEYERALQQLAEAKEVSRTLEDNVSIALYKGIILAEMGKAEESGAAFTEALRLKPDAALPVKVSPKVESDFEKLRGGVKNQIDPAENAHAKAKVDRPERAKAPPSLAPTAVPTDLQLRQEASGSTVKRAAPYVLFTAAVLAGAAGSYFGIDSRKHVNAARGAASPENARAELDRANSRAKLANGFFIGAGAAAIGSAVMYWLGRDDGPSQP